MKLHNPYLATPLSIEAYRNATSSADQHRQNVIAWLDRLQTSVRSSGRGAGTATNPFQLDTRVGKSGGQSDESDEDQGSQKHAQPRRASSGSDDTPVSPNTLVESDIDPYPDDAVPIGLLANLAISSSRDTAGAATEKTRKANNSTDDDEVVRVYRFLIRMGSGLMRKFRSLIGRCCQGVLHARPGPEPQLAQIIDRQDEPTRYFGA
jgi:hypothetical protein